MLSELNISGHRQHGKTYLLEHVVTDELRQGRRVLYLAYRYADVFEAFERIRTRLGAEVTRAVRANGDQRIEHASGGRAWFRALTMSGSAVSADTIVADGVDQFPDEWRVRVLPTLIHSRSPRVFTSTTTE